MKKATGGGLGTAEIEIASPEMILELILQSKQQVGCVDDFYTLDLDEKTRLSLMITNRSQITHYPKNSRLTKTEIEDEDKLFRSRRFMLIAKSDYLPRGSFASVYDKGYYYSIFNDDEISKKTLALISQIKTALAVPPQRAPNTHDLGRCKNVTRASARVIAMDSTAAEFGAIRRIDDASLCRGL